MKAQQMAKQLGGMPQGKKGGASPNFPGFPFSGPGGATTARRRNSKHTTYNPWHS